MRTKVRGVINNSYQLEVAYQEEEMCYVNQIVDDVQVYTLHDVDAGFEEIEIYINLMS